MAIGSSQHVEIPYPGWPSASDRADRGRAVTVLASFFVRPRHVRDGILITAGIATLAAFAAAAQEPPKIADPVVEEVSKAFSQEGIQERQVRALKSLIAAYEQQKLLLEEVKAKDAR